MALTELWRFHDQALERIDVRGFDVRARDGSIGSVAQAVEGTAGGYLVVDPGKAMPLGRQLLVPAGLVDEVDVDSGRISVRVDREQAMNAPEYDPRLPLEDPASSVFGEYFDSLMGDASRRAGVQKAPTRARRRNKSRMGGSRSTKGSARSRTRSRQAEGPTRDELYEEARRLDVSGRSKMSKAQLARAVSGRRGRASRSSSEAKANPVEVQAFLEGVGYPTAKRKLLREAESQGASREVRATLRRLPDQKFDSPTQVSKAIGKL
jgi:Protein of unknown function (DUF2795)